MERITSFCVNHNKLEPGIYISRIDGDITTYDIRMVKPNCPPFMTTAAMHTIEHLFATFSRNSKYKDSVIYFGPMGCRTGFYFLLRDVSTHDAVELIKQIFAQIAEFSGEIPGTTAVECGNYKEHDLPEAIRLVKNYLPVIANWNESKLQYQA